jgi:ABC-type lipoprotein release transport system permease subunit
MEVASEFSLNLDKYISNFPSFIKFKNIVLLLTVSKQINFQISEIIFSKVIVFFGISCSTYFVAGLPPFPKANSENQFSAITSSLFLHTDNL